MEEENIKTQQELFEKSKTRCSDKKHKNGNNKQKHKGNPRTQREIKFQNIDDTFGRELGSEPDSAYKYHRKKIDKTNPLRNLLEAVADYESSKSKQRYN